MRKGQVLFKGELAGMLIQFDDGSFEFKYEDRWFKDPMKPAVSLTLPKTTQSYHSPFLFPFFYHMLPEGSNKQAVCFHRKIDKDDDFGLLLATSKTDSIGAVSVIKSSE
ncbi:phosphatidylinositol kinase [Roseivirga spongicola]|uniref:Phosphatidylinositol kinase n=1 Tax=Roseivirga spongicola TaxID=333140 RepID=A0A150X3M9_9BACT|nr:HipA N-terminal domain-containing protein [Roseivirga spongicola]KYG73330.1 phosphatidylinositol kinase [Roseivirga spongicola]